MRGHVLGLEQEGLAAPIEVSADDGQAAKGDARKVVGHQVQEFRVRSGNARMHAALGLHARPERRGSTLELLVGN